MTTQSLVGEKVTIKDTGFHYGGYAEWIDEYVPLVLQKNWERRRALECSDDTYTILICDYHMERKDVLCYVQNDRNNNCFLISADGLNFLDMDNANSVIDELKKSYTRLGEENKYDKDDVKAGDLNMLF